MSANNPQTFLELVQATAQECDVSGTISTCQSQTGEAGRIVAWVSRACLRIERQHKDWKFMRKSTTWATVAGQAQYTTAQCGIAAKTFGRWQRQTFRNYVTTTGTDSEFPMNYIGYEVYRNAYFLGALRDVKSRPVEFAIGPDKSIWLGPVPDVGYTMEADYFVGPTELINDTDEPAIAYDDRMVIVYRAMMSYGRFESDPGIYGTAKLEYDRLMAAMTKSQLPEIRNAEALA